MFQVELYKEIKKNGSARSVCAGQVSAIPRKPPALSEGPGLAVRGGRTRDSGLPQPLRCARASLKQMTTNSFLANIGSSR